MAVKLPATPRPIPTAAHAPLDYITGGTTLMLPTLLGRVGGPSATALRVWGVTAYLSGLLSRHELGVVRVLPMRVHLASDALGGAVLAAVPWLTGDRRSLRAWLPPVLVGSSEILLAATTRTSDADALSWRARVQAALGGAGVAAGLALASRTPAALGLAAGGMAATAAALRRR